MINTPTMLLTTVPLIETQMVTSTDSSLASLIVVLKMPFSRRRPFEATVSLYFEISVAHINEYGRELNAIQSSKSGLTSNKIAEKRLKIFLCV